MTELSSIGSGDIGSFRIGSDIIYRSIISHSSSSKSKIDRIISLHRSSNNYSSNFSSNNNRTISINSAIYSNSDSIQSNINRLISLNRHPNSYINLNSSYTRNERTSLELIDYPAIWNDNKAVWHTPWVTEIKILGDEDRFVVKASVVDEAKEPAATVEIQYDETGNGEPDVTSDKVRVGKQERVHEVSGIPISEDGRYRMKISEYSGFNSLISLDMAITH